MSDSMTVDDRQKLLHKYTSRWDDCPTTSPVGLWPLPVSKPWEPKVKMWHTVKHDHLICAEESVVGVDMTNVRFVRLPSASLGMSTKEWNLSGIPGWPLEIHPPSNLLVASQETDGKS